jgi:hypothetical protein
MGKVGIVTVGGMETTVKVMKTVPKCETLQECACAALRNLACSSIGKTKAIESGGSEIILAAVNNPLDSAIVCYKAFWALHNITSETKEDVWQLISLGGGAAVAKSLGVISCERKGSLLFIVNVISPCTELIARTPCVTRLEVRSLLLL